MKILKQHIAFGGAVKYLEHKSFLTKTNMKFSVYEPSSKAKGVIIWLSGLTCTQENFMIKAAALEYLNQKSLIVVCPDTSPRGLSLKGEHDSWDFGSGASFYVNATTDDYKNNYQMHDYISIELYDLLANKYNLQTNTAIMGHSMGGHGALTMGLLHPEKFCSISAFAPIVAPTQCPWGKKAFTGYLGNKSDEWMKYDSCQLLYSGKKHNKPILISYGTNDEFLKEQLLINKFEIVANKMQQNIIINKCIGYDHSYYFISSFIKKHIDFHFPIPR
jgi:S-formylglutathione hydrolase